MDLAINYRDFSINNNDTIGFNHEQQVFNSKHRDSTINNNGVQTNAQWIWACLKTGIYSIYGNVKRPFQVFKQRIKGTKVFRQTHIVLTL
jgi:hypothetical protein